MLHVAASLDDVLRGNLEGCRAVFLLEGPCEVALVVILPFQQACDLVHEFRRLDTLASLIHGTLVGTLEGRITVVVEETTSREARLVAALAAHDVEDEGIARDLLVHFDFDYVTTLDRSPVRDDEATRLFCDNKSLDRLVVDGVAGLLEFEVGKHVHDASA